MEDPDLAEVAGVVADGDRFADVGGKDRVEVAQALEANAVAVHHPGRGDLDEQQVELLELSGVRRSQPSAIQACCGGCPVSLCSRW